MRSLKNISRTVVVTIGMLLMMTMTIGSTFAANLAEESVTGTGTLRATGSGTAQIGGSGQVIIQRGFGEVYVSGADSIDTVGRGYHEVLDDGRVRLQGIAGNVTIRGTNMSIKIIGGRVGFRADGNGTVTLKGQGLYDANGNNGRWTEEGVTLTIEV
ncbi:MAG: hypothetical protein GFH27_549311n28 [Chloroflexi bacterium AL-W]|nr:hypothetical protein [Chloroflexi bacterium AL-N1]NOK68794.1 hypothetical protein [Chloroflexi bacterium AL-N10]NOK76280.1 hypothetical protein [Chloroflexi bacterium AL-N5]NOK84083.1 hypothetical protein [Chloroflexi bacterium AL-W]NOK91418.1 hypothetical protein [Chloroflexi bacterium AL-N15]